MRVVKEFRNNIFIIILLISTHSEGGVLSTKPDRSDQLELLEFHKEAFCGEQSARDDRLGLESYVNSILRNEKEGVAGAVFQMLSTGDEQLCLDGLTILILKGTYREIFGLTKFTNAQTPQTDARLCPTEETAKVEEERFPAVEHISDKVTKSRPIRVSISSFAPVTTTAKPTTAAAITSKPVATTTRSRNYYKTHFKVSKNSLIPSARSSLSPINPQENTEPLLGYHVTMCADFARAGGANEQTAPSFQAGLKCPDGKLIHIELANYGRNNSLTCARGKSEANDAWFLPCDSYSPTGFLDVTKLLREDCEMKSECSFAPAFPAFCPGISKYTEIRYNCKYNAIQ
ncbi:Oidioi.mRNA.OKI2018_I69.chr1.g1758.t1.cds [Oikopleura dioica]|uniref:Oidioi.mRNA.OKI2018_I69.chr1.g1758.t1.cds n=1 Tax=Oikopleura dioica TaxID=34765 RepID=A0ABN7ST49_OIKDI|nr:Oidioi.mRNA.OKI2018_I69.chr1.g1758.t1.cds [Oikopleura dioica]